MVNCTEMAKPFGKQGSDWGRLQSTQDFLDKVSSDRGIPRSALY